MYSHAQATSDSLPTSNTAMSSEKLLKMSWRHFDALAAKQQERIQALTIALQNVGAQLAVTRPSYRIVGGRKMSESSKRRLWHGGSATRAAVNNP